MPGSPDNINEIKRKLRSLKKLEVKIRFGGRFHAANIDKNLEKMHLVWDDFFSVRGTGNVKAKYTLAQISLKSKDEFKDIINEFFFSLYYKYYNENGFVNFHLYNPEILKWMDLSPGAGQEEIKKRFRELAKKYHPDTGGDSGEFIELMENYNKLI